MPNSMLSYTCTLYYFLPPLIGKAFVNVCHGNAKNVFRQYSNCRREITVSIPLLVIGTDHGYSSDGNPSLLMPDAIVFF